MDRRIRVEEENVPATLYKKIEKLENENKELVARDKQIQYKCTEVRELKDQI